LGNTTGGKAWYLEMGAECMETMIAKLMEENSP